MDVLGRADDRSTLVLYSGGGKGCILGTTLSGIVTIPWHVNHTNQMLVV